MNQTNTSPQPIPFQLVFPQQNTLNLYIKNIEEENTEEAKEISHQDDKTK